MGDWVRGAAIAALVALVACKIKPSYAVAEELVLENETRPTNGEHACTCPGVYAVVADVETLDDEGNGTAKVTGKCQTERPTACGGTVEFKITPRDPGPGYASPKRRAFDRAYWSITVVRVTPPSK